MFSSPGSQVQSLFIPLFLPQIRGKIPELLSHHFSSSCLSYAAKIKAWLLFLLSLILEKIFVFFFSKTLVVFVFRTMLPHRAH